MSEIKRDVARRLISETDMVLEFGSPQHLITTLSAGTGFVAGLAYGRSIYEKTLELLSQGELQSSTGLTDSELTWGVGGLIVSGFVAYQAVRSFVVAQLGQKEYDAIKREA